MSTVNVENLWESYNNNKDRQIREKLVVKYLPLIKHIASRVNINLPPYLEYEDLISYGMFGLMQAIDRYDMTKGVKFETYAYTRIRGSIIDELRKLDWIPQATRKKAKMLQDVFSNLEQNLGRSVNDKDICDYLEIDIKQLNDIYTEVSPLYGILSFDDLIGLEDEKQVSIQPDIYAEKEELKEILGNAINQLPHQEKLVITLYYYEDMNFKEIAQVFDLSQGRISQLHTKAILRLKGCLNKKRAVL